LKREEEIAQGFLRAFFQKEPIYEPLKKGSPPDFCIEGTAFEVRRLNQHYINADGTVQGLEEVSYPLRDALNGELSKISFLPHRGSFFWILDFERPLEAKPSKIAREIARRASFHYSSGSRSKQTLTAHGVTVELAPASNLYQKAFLLGIEVDGDSGGWSGDIYQRPIQCALEEKIKKTRAVAERFDRWFLVLVDSIMTGIEDVGTLTLNLQHFNGIVVINPNGSLALEWPKHCLKLL
jgi:hypothetical protein